MRPFKNLEDLPDTSELRIDGETPTGLTCQKETIGSRRAVLTVLNGKVQPRSRRLQRIVERRTAQPKEVGSF